MKSPKTVACLVVYLMFVTVGVVLASIGGWLIEDLDPFNPQVCLQEYDISEPDGLCASYKGYASGYHVRTQIYETEGEMYDEQLIAGAKVGYLKGIIDSVEADCDLNNGDSLMKEYHDECWSCHTSGVPLVDDYFDMVLEWVDVDEVEDTNPELYGAGFWLEEAEPYFDDAVEEVENIEGTVDFVSWVIYHKLVGTLYDFKAATIYANTGLNMASNAEEMLEDIAEMLEYNDLPEDCED